MPRDAASPLPTTSAWPDIERDLRLALDRQRISATAIEAVMSELAPIWRATERARLAGIDGDMVWSLVALAADRARRRAQAERVRPA